MGKIYNYFLTGLTCATLGLVGGFELGRYDYKPINARVIRSPRNLVVEKETNFLRIINQDNEKRTLMIEINPGFYISYDEWVKQERESENRANQQQRVSQETARNDLKERLLK